MYTPFKIINRSPIRLRLSAAVDHSLLQSPVSVIMVLSALFCTRSKRRI